MGYERTVIDDNQARIDGLNEMIHDLLVFARPTPPGIAPAGLTTLLTGTMALLRRDPAWTNVDVVVPDDGPTLPMDAAQVQLAVFNLRLNAAQAMQGHGRIDVTVETADGWCEIGVRDSGPGFDPELREKLFEPFFTTKYRGSGLGLATAKTGDRDASRHPDRRVGGRPRRRHADQAAEAVTARPGDQAAGVQ